MVGGGWSGGGERGGEEIIVSNIIISSIDLRERKEPCLLLLSEIGKHQSYA